MLLSWCTACVAHIVLHQTIEQTIKSAEAAEAKIQAEKEAVARKERELLEEKQRQQRRAQEEADRKRREAEAAAAAAEEAKRKEREKLAAEAAAREEEKRQAVVKAAEERKRKQAEAEAAVAAKAKEDAAAQELLASASDPGSSLGGELVLKRNEWRKWREVMATIKSQVIGRVKQDDAMRRALRRTKNTITMRVGQVVNTKESILKIVGQACTRFIKVALKCLLLDRGSSPTLVQSTALETNSSVPFCPLAGTTDSIPLSPLPHCQIHDQTGGIGNQCETGSCISVGQDYDRTILAGTSSVE